MVHRDKRGGTLILDRRCGKLGRLHIASGTNDPKVFAQLDAMISELRAAHRWDLLGLLYPPPGGGRPLVAPLELRRALYAGRLGDLPTVDDVRPLMATVERWLATLDLADETTGQYKRLLATLESPSATLADLPSFVAAARTTHLAAGTRTTFNRLHTAARQLLVATLGDRHRLVDALDRIERLREERRKGNPQSVDAIRALATQLGAHGPSLWALVLTGMRRGEYFGRRWRVLEDRVHVVGTKSKDAVRDVPLVYRPADPTCGADHMNHLLHDETKGAMRLHDTRYTWMRWLEDAGVPALRIKQYAGHAVGDVTELYRRGRGFAEYLVADGERVREWLGEPPAPALKVVEG